MPPYLVDTNFFIQAHRTGNPLDIAESYWKKVKELADNHKIISIDKVKKEIYGTEDELKQWCEHNLPHDFFKNSALAIPFYAQIVNWAHSKKSQYKQDALDEFMDADEADAWLVAYALANQNAIVTNEVSAPLSKSKIKIPDVCIQFNVKCLNPMQMFRALGERY